MFTTLIIETIIVCIIFTLFCFEDFKIDPTKNNKYGKLLGMSLVTLILTFLIILIIIINQ